MTDQQNYALPHDSEEFKAGGLVQSNTSLGANQMIMQGSYDSRNPADVKGIVASDDQNTHKNKQSFIYSKKEPVTAQKPMQRKLRPSQTATQGLQRSFNHTADPGAHTGVSQNDAETIATNDASNNVPPSPRASVGYTSNVRQDSEVIAQSEPAGRKAFKVRKFRSNQKASGQQQYYEDNIDSETEVFFEPEQKQHNRHSGLFSDTDPEYMQPSYNGDIAAQLSNHFKEIDLVLGSNFDEKTKQKMIKEIQQKYKQINDEAQRRSKKPLAQNLRSRTQKKFKMQDLDQDEIFFQDQNRRMQSLMQQDAIARKKKQGGYQSLQMQSSQIKSAAEPNRKKGQYQKKVDPKMNKTATQGKQRPRNHENYDQNKHYLMSEVTQFMDDQHTQKHYQTQDESFQKAQVRGARSKQRDQRDKRQSQSRSPHPHTLVKAVTPTVLKHDSSSAYCDCCYKKQKECDNKQSRLSQKGGSPKRSIGRDGHPKAVYVDRIDDSDEIDYDSMDQRQKRKPAFTPGRIRAQRQDPNNYMSPHGTDRTPDRRIKVKNNSRAILNQSQPNYNEILPAVKIRGQQRVDSKSNFSQSINFGAQDISVPKRQTQFYDSVHGANVTAVKVDQWKDDPTHIRFDARGPRGPTNRHRIPDPAPLFNIASVSPARNSSNKRSHSPQAKTKGMSYNYDWDLDGRRHIKQKSKRDVPVTNPEKLPLLQNKSGSQGNDQPTNIQLHQNSSIEGDTPFLRNQKGPNVKSISMKAGDPRLGDLRNDSSILYVNQQSNNDIPNNSKIKVPGSDTEVKVMVEPPKSPKDPYKAKIDAAKKKNSKMGDKLLVEDDFITKEDFVDHGLRKHLQDKALQNVTRKDKSGSPGSRKPSIASNQRRSGLRNKRPSRKSSQGDSIGSAGRGRTPASGERPISGELDRQSNQSDPYKIMEQTKSSADSRGQNVPPHGKAVPKPKTAQNPNRDVEKPVPDVLVKSAEFIQPDQMKGSRPDQVDSADHPNIAYSNVQSQPPYLRGEPDQVDSVDVPASAPHPENANISEKQPEHPVSIFDQRADINSQEEPGDPGQHYQRPMSGTSTKDAEGIHGIDRTSQPGVSNNDGKPSSVSKEGQEVTSPKDGKSKSSGLPPFKKGSSKSPKKSTINSGANLSPRGKASISPRSNQQGKKSPRCKRHINEKGAQAVRCDSCNALKELPLPKTASPRKTNLDLKLTSQQKSPRGAASPPKLGSEGSKQSPRLNSQESKRSKNTKKSKQSKSPIGNVVILNSPKSSNQKAGKKSDKRYKGSQASPKQKTWEANPIDNQVPSVRRSNIQSQEVIHDYNNQPADDLKSSEGQLGMLGQSGTVFGSQVRFMDGHRASEENIHTSQVVLGQKLETHIKHIGSENAYEERHSHYTKLVASGHAEQYSADKSVSYPTGYTKFQHNANVPLNILKNPTDNSTTYDFPAQPEKLENVEDRAQTTQSPGKRRMNAVRQKSSGNDDSRGRSGATKSRGSVTRKSSQRPMRFGAKNSNTSEMYIPKTPGNEIHSQGGARERMSSGLGSGLNRHSQLKSQASGITSKSPTRKLMEDLTHQKAHINEDTVILINATEKLSKKGIEGKIHNVGVGFGTGRHTAGKEKREELKVVNKSRSSGKSKKRTVQQQTKVMQMDTTGCDAVLVSVKSEILSAIHISMKDGQNSPRTASVLAEQESVGITAKALSIVSLREQCDQVTEHRFEPLKEDMGVGTGTDLLDIYLAKQTHTMAIGTEPIVIDDRHLTYADVNLQTDVIVEERDTPEEPVVMIIPPCKEAGKEKKPRRIRANSQDPEDGVFQGSQEGLEGEDDDYEVTSQLSEPVPEEVYPFDFPPPQEPEDDGHVDDWADSDLYKYVKDLHYDKLVKKGLMDPAAHSRPSTATSQLGMNQQQKYEYNLNPEMKNILSYMEVDYGQSAMRHKSANYTTLEMQQDLFDRSKTTIEVLTLNMVRPDICNHILFTHYKDVTKKNCIKLLLRCKRLYDARNESVSILKMCTEVECCIKPKSAIWRILQDNSSQPLKKGHHAVVMRTLKMLSNALTRITIFNQEHRLFHGEFKFNKEEYRYYLTNIGAIIGGFLLNKRQLNPSLQENGLVEEKHDDSENQQAVYKEWVAKSLAEYGKLELPSEEVDTILPEVEKKQTTRVDAALEKLKVDIKREESEKVRRASEKNAIKVISSKPSLAVLEQDIISEVNSEHKAVGPTEQMEDRLAEREERKKRLLQQQIEVEMRDQDSPSRPAKQYGLNLLKQQLTYDSDMEDQQTHNIASQEGLNYGEVKRPDTQAKEAYGDYKEIEPEQENEYQEDGFKDNFINLASDNPSSSCLQTHKNFVVGDYDLQSQNTEKSPFKRDAPVTKIAGLRLNMKQSSPQRQNSPRKTKTDRDFESNSLNRVNNNSQINFEVQQYSIDSKDALRAMQTPEHHRIIGAPSESTVGFGRAALINSQQLSAIEDSIASEFTCQQERSQKIGFEIASNDDAMHIESEMCEIATSPTHIRVEQGRLKVAGSQELCLPNSRINDTDEETIFHQESEAESPVKPVGKRTRVRFNDSDNEQPE